MYEYSLSSHLNRMIQKDIWTRHWRWNWKHHSTQINLQECNNFPYSIIAGKTRSYICSKELWIFWRYSHDEYIHVGESNDNPFYRSKQEKKRSTLFHLWLLKAVQFLNPLCVSVYTCISINPISGGKAGISRK